MFNIKMAIFTALTAILFWWLPSLMGVGLLGNLFCKGLSIIIGALLAISIIAGIFSNIKDKFGRW